MICIDCGKKEWEAIFATHKVNGTLYFRKYCTDCYKEKERIRVKKYRDSNLENDKIRQKRRRSKAAHKIYMVKYLKKNKDKIQKQQRVRTSRFQKSAVIKLSDYYVKRILKRRSPKLPETPAELICAKREHLNLIRAIRER